MEIVKGLIIITVNKILKNIKIDDKKLKIQSQRFEPL